MWVEGDEDNQERHTVYLIELFHLKLSDLSQQIESLQLASILFVSTVVKYTGV